MKTNFTGSIFFENSLGWEQALMIKVNILCLFCRATMSTYKTSVNWKSNDICMRKKYKKKKCKIGLYKDIRNK